MPLRPRLGRDGPGISTRVSEREQRIAHNETVFRSANEQLRDAREELHFKARERTPFICECGDPGCTTTMLLSLSEYEAVRRDPNTFAVVPGHDDPATESVVGNVVEPNDRFVVVEKREHLRDHTAATDPRA